MNLNREKSLPTPDQLNLIWEEDEVNAAEPLDLSNSEAEAEEFIRKRLAIFLLLMENYNLLQLVGHTAVGKSHLIEEIKAILAETIQVYHELDNFEAWATDSSEKTKILCIDESNINNQHFTMFAPLIKGGAARVLYKGKFYDLTDKHKVLFIRNPHDYGGGRNSQKLFADGDIPEFHLKDLPPAFIYERMLRPIYVPNQQYSEVDFKKAAADFLTNYLLEKKNNPVSVPVRGLQEQVLSFFAGIDKKPRFFHQSKPRIDLNPHFIPTPSTKALRSSFKNFLGIHKNCPPGIGLHGFYLEGRPGMGKSELIADGLARSGYQLVSTVDNLSGNASICIKIDASMPRTAT